MKTFFENLHITIQIKDGIIFVIDNNNQNTGKEGDPSPSSFTHALNEDFVFFLSSNSRLARAWPLQTTLLTQPLSLLEVWLPFTKPLFVLIRYYSASFLSVLSPVISSIFPAALGSR